MSAQFDQASSAPIVQFNTESTTTPKGHINDVGYVLFRRSILIECQGRRWDHHNNTPIFDFNELTEEFVCEKVLENGFIATETPPITVVIMSCLNNIFLNSTIDKSNGDPYAPLARAQHLSQFKAALFDKFRPLSYLGLYRGLKLRASALCIKVAVDRSLGRGSNSASLIV